MHRFYLPPSSWDREPLALEGAEAHHARDVLRVKPGSRVVVFNGRGSEVTAEVTALNRDRLDLRRLHETKTAAVPCRVTLAQAIPKGKNMELIVQKAVELGAATIVPLLSDRTVVELEGEATARKAEKWTQVAIEACKQCGQNWLPEVRPPTSVREFFATREAYDLRLIGSLQPNAEPLKKVLADYRADHRITATRVLMCVGPEGDFTPAELGLARSAGCVPVSLGPIVLRVETAAIFCLSVLSYELFS